MTQIQPRRRRRVDAARVRLEQTLLVVGVVALGFNLRTAIASLPPIFPELQTGPAYPTATVSVLAATPVICFGVVSGFAAALARRLGEERVLFAAIIALTAGLAAPRGRAVGGAVPRHDPRRRRHRDHERAALQPDQAALAGAGGDARSASTSPRCQLGAIAARW